jgi:hypothetical protein
MIAFDEKTNKQPNKNEVIISFVNFIGRKMLKMNPIVIEKLTKWNGISDPYSYLEKLQVEIGELEPYEGLSHANSFVEFLPHIVGAKMEKAMMTEIEKNVVEMEKNLVAVDVNLGSSTKKINAIDKKIKKKIKMDKIPKENWSDQPALDPFKNGNAFAKYYQSFMRDSANVRSKDYEMYDVRFEDIAIDSETGTQIIDLLIDNKRKSKQFIDAWFIHYLENHLSGKKINVSAHTSLKSLKKTFNDFNELFCY